MFNGTRCVDCMMSVIIIKHCKIVFFRRKWVLNLSFDRVVGSTPCLSGREALGNITRAFTLKSTHDRHLVLMTQVFFFSWQSSSFLVLSTIIGSEITFLHASTQARRSLDDFAKSEFYQKLRTRMLFIIFNLNSWFTNQNRTPLPISTSISGHMVKVHISTLDPTQFIHMFILRIDDN